MPTLPTETCGHCLIETEFFFFLSFFLEEHELAVDMETISLDRDAEVTLPA